MGDTKNPANEPLPNRSAPAVKLTAARTVQLMMGTLSPNPWDLTLWGQNACNAIDLKRRHQSCDSMCRQTTISFGRF